MKLWIGLLLAALLVGCGAADNGENGKDGRPGENGEDGTSVPGEDGETGPVGPVGPGGSPGRPGEDALLASTTCTHDWVQESGRGFKVHYNVLHFKDGSVLASLYHYHYDGGATDFHTSSSALFTKENSEVSTAKLENNLWAVSLNGKDKAKVVYKPLSQTKDAVCKYSVN